MLEHKNTFGGFKTKHYRTLTGILTLDGHVESELILRVYILLDCRRPSTLVSIHDILVEWKHFSQCTGSQLQICIGSDGRHFQRSPFWMHDTNESISEERFILIKDVPQLTSAHLTWLASEIWTLDQKGLIGSHFETAAMLNNFSTFFGTAMPWISKCTKKLKFSHLFQYSGVNYLTKRARRVPHYYANEQSRDHSWDMHLFQKVGS